MAMWTDTYENWETLFPEEIEDQKSDANTLFLGVVCFILDDPRVEKVIHRTDINRNENSMFFCPEQGMFGRPLKNKAGEDVWLRVRSFVERAPMPNRSFESMIPGEIREMVIVVGNRSIADITVVRAWAMAKDNCLVDQLETRASNTSDTPKLPELPDSPSSSPPSSPTRSTPAQPVGEFGLLRRTENETTHVIYGCGVFPFMLPDAHSNKKKSKTWRVRGYDVLFHGSADVKNTKGNDSIKRGMSLFAFSEWVMECRQLRYPKEGPFAISYELNEYESQFERFIANASEREQQYRTGHQPDDNLPPQTVKTIPRAISMAHTYAEFLSLAAMIDIIASGTLNGIPSRIFSHPHLFPLYTAVAIVIAANPHYFFPPAHSVKFAEDGFFINQLFGQYKSLHKQTTPLELMVYELSIQTGRFLSQERVQKKLGKETARPSDEFSHVPIGIEFMRRQALTLAHELFSPVHQATQKERFDEATAFFPPSVVADAMENLSSSVERRVDVERSAKGFFGSNKHNAPRSLRTSSRDAMARIALQILLDVNEYLSSGVFRMQKLTSENEIVPIMEAGIEVHVNLSAWADTKRIANVYFANGAMFLVENCNFLTFPVRPRTKVRCGGCLEMHSPLETASSHMCRKCHVHLCISCSSGIEDSFCRTCTASPSCGADQTSSTGDGS